MPRLFTAFVLLAVPGPAPADDYPHVFLKNEKLKVKVYLPDAEKGFYRGTRFDHAGVLGEIEFAGHNIFGPWKDTHDPTNHDDIIGPVEEFGMETPLGYAEAKVGETFLKIGVGELEKPKEEKYSFAKKYRVVKPAEWVRLDTKEQAGREVAWETKASHPSGYGYKYAKAVSLAPDGGEAPVVLIAHKLVNTGTKPIVTDVYNHNFFNVDGDPVGPNYSFAFPFDAKARDEKGKFGELVELKGGEFRFKDKLTDGFVMAGLAGFDPAKAAHRGFGMRHARSGVRVDVYQTQPYSKFNIWGMKTTICPEPYTAIELKPGEQMLWTIGYTFTDDPPKK
jgi:hypothetical protein